MGVICLVNKVLLLKGDQIIHEVAVFINNYAKHGNRIIVMRSVLSSIHYLPSTGWWQCLSSHLYRLETRVFKCYYQQKTFMQGRRICLYDLMNYFWWFIWKRETLALQY